MKLPVVVFCFLTLTAFDCNEGAAQPAVDHGVTVTQTGSPTKSNETWYVQFRLEPLKDPAPADPEVMPTDKYRHQRVVLTVRDVALPAGGAASSIKSVKATVDGESASVNRADAPADIGSSMRVRWSDDGQSVELKQKQYEQWEDWHVTLVTIGMTIPSGGPKRGGCRAGMNANEGTTANPPADPIQYRRATNAPVQSIWGMQELDFETDAERKLIVADENKQLQDDDLTYITATPAMPRLRAWLQPGLPKTNIDWTLTMTFNKPDATSNEAAPQADALLPATKRLDGALVWQISSGGGTALANSFRGGDANVKAAFTENETPQNLNRPFLVRGLNPADADAKAFIQGCPNAPWYSYAIAKHESFQPRATNADGRHYNQFNPPLQTSPTPGRTSVVYLPNFGPNPNGGGGWGMFQLDNFDYLDANGALVTRTPNRDELWNWQANAAIGVRVILRKRELARNALNKLKPGIWEAGGAGMPTITIGTPGVTFAPGTDRTPLELEAIKKYNGSRYFDQYRAATQTWDYSDANDYVTNVVSKLD